MKKPLAKAPGIKASMPSLIKPMLCTLIREPFTEPGWLYEVKLDGYRIVAYKKGTEVIMRSRSGIDYTSRYPKLVAALKKINGTFVIDGEVVAYDEEGNISFDNVQSANPTAPLAYYVFDIVYKDGYNLMQLPLIERKTILQKTLPAGTLIKYSEHFDDGIQLFKQAEERHLEGIVCKKIDSAYQQDKRGAEWLKLPAMKRQEFVIGGWAESTKARSFKSLLFGAYNNEHQFEWIGRSGGGFGEKDMPAILKKLLALEIKESPFVNKILDTKGAIIHYVKPRLVANFQFATWTTTGRIRKPATFLSFRSDKDPKTVVREVPLSVDAEEKVITEPKKIKAAKLKTMASSNWPDIEKIPLTSAEEFEVDDCTIQLTNVEQELWPGISKGKLILYYNSIADYILPHIKNRPLSLNIKTGRPTASGLYIKDMEGRERDCAEIFTTNRKHPKAGKTRYNRLPGMQ